MLQPQFSTRHTCLLQMVKLFQRVATGEIQMDAEEAQQMSPAGQDLLRGMLLPDPRQRLAVPSVISHPWFQHSLPQGAALMNDLLMNEQGAPPLQTSQVSYATGCALDLAGSACAVPVSHLA